MGDGTYYPPDVPAAWESGRRQGHLDKASEVAAAIAERDALRAEVERLREALITREAVIGALEYHEDLSKDDNPYPAGLGHERWKIGWEAARAALGGDT